MRVSLWGSQLWHVLHCVTFDYPETPSAADKLHYLQFFQSLAFVLPCEKCQKHFQELMGPKSPLPLSPALKNRDTLSRWLVDVHNLVNERTGKPSMTYESVRDRYVSMQQTGVDPTQRVFCWTWVILLLSLLVGIVMVVQHVRKS